MSQSVFNTYKEWSILITESTEMCSNFSFEITSPQGISQKVAMGGKTAETALERAKEMIDLEITFNAEE